MKITINQNDLNRVMQRLQKVERFHEWATIPMTQSVELLKDQIAKYPPKPSTSTYIRTGTLGRRWTTSITRKSTGLTGRVGNNTVYAPYVQSDERQAWWHRRTGWVTDKKVLERNQATVVAYWQRAVNRVLRG